MRWWRAATAVEDVGDDKIHEQRRDLVQACLQLTACRQERGQRDALAYQDSGEVEQSATDVDDAISVDIDVAEEDRFFKDLRRELALEQR